MAYDNATRTRVRTMYVQGADLTVAAATHGVSYATARRWKNEDEKAGADWDIARNARRMTRDGVGEMANAVLDELAVQFLATLEALKADQRMPPDKRANILVALMDGYNKALGAAGKAMPNANRLAAAMDVLRFLGQRIADRFPQFRGPFVEIAEALGDDLVREFGSGG